tara:strand:+ start:132 stop:512 length:381 start_codon:yes stop_codon:yes gene_type:complete
MGKQSNKRRLSDSEALARSKAIRISPQKLNLVAGLIRGKKVDRALADLTFSKRRVSDQVKKVLQAAIANAENNHQLDVDQLIVTEASVGRAFAMRRWRARARGRGAGITKPYSNLTIIVKENQEQE